MLEHHPQRAPSALGHNGCTAVVPDKAFEYTCVHACGGVHLCLSNAHNAWGVHFVLEQCPQQAPSALSQDGCAAVVPDLY
eukprot:1152769-Pelagomonas_calceolata.AAC.6